MAHAPQFEFPAQMRELAERNVQQARAACGQFIAAARKAQDLIGTMVQCGDEELFAVSSDKAGRNIPRSSCTQGWLLRQEFELGRQHPVPVPIGPEPVLRSITDKGYYLWRAGC